MEKESPARTTAFLAGLLLAGYGLLVALRVLAHESFWLGLLLLAAGGLLVLAARPAARGPAETHGPSPRGRVIATAAFGAAAAGGVIGYNLVAASNLSAWEIGIVVYGALLLFAASRLDQMVGPTSIGNLVAWSFPLIAAPLGVFALDAALKSQTGGSPIDPFLMYGLVAPMAWSLDLLGFDVQTLGQTVMLGTSRGTLSLSVGTICAGFQPGILFLGILGLHAWKQQTPPGRLSLYLGLGLIGIYLANLIRLIALALVGHQWGGAALQTAHAHFGWILFFGWMLLFWWIVLRRIEGQGRPVKKPTA